MHSRVPDPHELRDRHGFAHAVIHGDGFAISVIHPVFHGHPHGLTIDERHAFEERHAERLRDAHPFVQRDVKSDDNGDALLLALTVNKVLAEPGRLYFILPQLDARVCRRQ